MRRSSKPLPRSLTSLGGPSLATPPGGSTPTKGSSRGDVSSRTSAVGRSVSRGRYGATPSSTVPNHGSSLTFTGSSSTVWGSRTTFTSAANHRVLAPTRASKAHLYNYDGQAENLRYLQRRDPKIHPSVKVPSVNDVTKRLTTADNSRHGDIEREHIRLHHMHDPRVRKSQSRNLNEIIERVTKPTIASTANVHDFDNQDANLAYLKTRDPAIHLPYKTNTYLRLSHLPQARRRLEKD